MCGMTGDKEGIATRSSGHPDPSLTRVKESREAEGGRRAEKRSRKRRDARKRGGEGRREDEGRRGWEEKRADVGIEASDDGDGRLEVQKSQGRREGSVRYPSVHYVVVW